MVNFKSTPDQATGDNYTSLLKINTSSFLHSVTVLLKNTGAQTLKYTLYASNDPTGASGSWDAIDLDAVGTTEGSLTAGSTQSWDLGLFVWIDIQTKSAAPSTPSTVTCWAHAV